MNFCILRTKKLKTVGEAIKSARHTFREIPTPNADKNRTHLNKTEGAQSSPSLAQAINARLPEKRRHDAVVCIEYLITASPEWWTTTPENQHRSYIDAAMRWLKVRHGGDNVVCLNVQLDEKSPHLVAYVVPLTVDGRLSATDFLGSPAKMTAMQTEFARDVAAKFGLQRGLEGSKAVHKTAKQYAAAMQKNPTLTAPSLPPPTIADRITGKARQMQEEHEKQQARYVALVEQARNIALVSQHNRVKQAAALKRLRSEVETAKHHEVEAARLRKENQQLKERDKEREQAFAAEKRSFMQLVSNLKVQLQEAISEVKRMAARILFLEDKLLPRRQNRHLTVDNDDSGSSLKFRP